MERERLEQVTWDAGFSGWATKFAHKNAWRVAPMLDPDDLVQEFAIRFVVVLEKYPKAFERAHIMSLFKRACGNRLTDLCRTKMRHVPLVGWDEDIPDEGEQDMAVAITDAPTNVRAFIDGVLDGGDTTCCRLKGGGRETTNEMMNRVAGTTHRIDLRTELANWAGYETRTA